MSDLSVSLFGKLKIHVAGTSLESRPPQKAQELLVYLLLHRRAHPREKLATLLWHRGSTERAKAYLRKALWQLRQALDPDEQDVGPVLLAEEEWIQIHPDADLWVDVSAFEEAFDAVRDCDAAEMSADQVEALTEAASLYTGDLLENWYQEWCLKERERLKDVLLRMLDRLTRCCEQEGAYDSGIQYGLRALRIDPARERIHRQLMRLRMRAGNRTGALRQYERCAEVLERELGVGPTTATQSLYEHIQEDRFPVVSPRESATGPVPLVSHNEQTYMGDGGESTVGSATPLETSEVSIRDGLDRLRQLQSTLAAVQKQIRREVHAVEVVLEQQR